MSDSPFVPVVPAGGSGTRLWPLSRAAHPKFLLDLTGSGRSLLQQTLDRLAPLADRPALVVTGAAHARAVAEQIGDAGEVIVEPSPRSSMPAIALAAAIARRRDPGAIIGSFAADHLIEDVGSFAQCVRTAVAVARSGRLVTLGIEPTHPATGFGYIERAEPAADGSDAQVVEAGGLPVARFVEKPERERAEEFLAHGGFSWNAGMFVVRADALLEALAEQLPALAAGVQRIAAAHGTDAQQEVLEREWPQLTSIAIDHALAEPLAAKGRVAVVPAAFDWDDVGDFAALARQLRRKRGGEAIRRVGDRDVRVLGDAPVLARDAAATVHATGERLVAVVGVAGISVVDTPDALLVVADDRAQDVGALVASLADRGLGELR